MKIDTLCLAQRQTAEEYLQHAYEIPEEVPFLPMPDEAFVSKWQEAAGRTVLDFLIDGLSLPALDFSWEDEEGLGISFAQTLGGRLPVISTSSHEDFRAMDALMSGREEKRELPLTVNAFTIEAKAENIFHHRLLLLNRAPYSNIPAARLGLGAGDWLERSYRLRRAHECAHYETLRLLGGMKNHALDEILADTFGQLAGFGDFSADRQRLFFGLTKGETGCTGRLSFYTQKVAMEERDKVYAAVDKVLDMMEAEIKALLSRKAKKVEILAELAGRSIADRLAQGFPGK